MPSDDQAVPPTYACRCLNIRISTSVSPSERPTYPSDPNYSAVFVNDDGIQVNHPQATVRLMSKPVPVPGTSKHSRFTALTCLFCDLSVYRVHHIISLDIEGNSTTFLPSEEWVEKDVLKSGTGWIDVHKDCLPRDDVAKALSATSYVSLFAMTLPGTLSFPPLPESNDDTDSPPPEEKGNDITHLPHMKPVFLPPPFTPSNQLFIHLADVANKQSQCLRSQAEERIWNFIKSEAAEILEKERIIKAQVLCFWKEFLHHFSGLQLDISRKARSPTRLGDPTSTNGLVSARGTPSSVAVRSFAPTPLSSSARHATSPQPRISALSASLATSTFHYPTESRRRSTEIESTTPGSDGDQTPDSRSLSSTLTQSTTNHGEEANILQFRRTVDDDMNTQASYRYFVDLEEDMERLKRTKELKSSREKEANTNQHEHVAPSVTSKHAPESDTHESHANEATTSGQKDSQKETSPPRGRDKGKRKVTFDVKPAVVATENNEKPADRADQEIIFRLDDMVPVPGIEVPTDDSQNTLPLLEQPPPRPITIKRRSLNAGSEVFQSLRPTSLPAPSHIRPIRSPPGVDSSHGMLPLAKPPSPPKAMPEETMPSPSLNENERQLLKLVAADTPSHRGAWNPGSENWNKIIGKTSDDDDDESTEEDEEDEDHTAQSTPVAFPTKALADRMEARDLDNKDPHMVGSLPIKIKKVEPLKPLSLASYVGQDAHHETAEPAAPTLMVNGKKPSSSSIRKAVYLEKDRARAIDPGPLDSVVEDDETEDDAIADAQDDGEKARLQALRILQTRSEIPEEGMWRSLA